MRSFENWNAPEKGAFQFSNEPKQWYLVLAADDLNSAIPAVRITTLGGRQFGGYLPSVQEYGHRQSLDPSTTWTAEAIGAATAPNLLSHFRRATRHSHQLPEKPFLSFVGNKPVLETWLPSTTQRPNQCLDLIVQSRVIRGPYS